MAAIAALSALAAASHDATDRSHPPSPLISTPPRRSREIPGRSAYEHFLERSLSGEGLHLRTSDVNGRSLGWGGGSGSDGGRRNRRLNDPSIYRAPRIEFDASNLEPLVTSYPAEVKHLKDVVLPKVSDIWASALKVLPVEGTIYVDPGVCGPEVDIPLLYQRSHAYVESAAGRGAKADLVVFARGFVGDEGGCVTNMLGSAVPCLLSTVNDRPVVGVVFFCLETVKKVMATGTLGEEEILDFGKHEFTHLLGMTSLLYPFYRDMATEDLAPRTPYKKAKRMVCTGNRTMEALAPSKNTILMGTTPTGMVHFDVVTPAVRQVARNQFGCETLPGARLENQPTNSLDCFGSHWDERLFLTELMGPRLDRGQILSPLTLAMMEDTGWYLADYSQAEGVSPFGHGMGCDFVEENCLAGGEVPEYARGNFCNRRMHASNGTLENTWSCDPSLQYRAQCDLVEYNVFINAARNPPPQDIGTMYYQMEGFEGENLKGPFAMMEADYCPIAHLRKVSCRDKSVTAKVNGEKYGMRSMCFEGTIQSHVSGFNKDGLHSLCLRSKCKPESGTLEVYINGNTVVCETDFQVHPYHWSGNQNDKFICPRLSQACPNQFCPKNCRGRGQCEFSVDGKRAECACADVSDTTPDCSETPYCALSICPLQPTPQPTILPATVRFTPGPTERPVQLYQRSSAASESYCVLHLFVIQIILTWTFTFSTLPSD